SRSTPSRCWRCCVPGCTGKRGTPNVARRSVSCCQAESRKQAEGMAMDTAQDRANILVVDDLPDKLLVYESILESLGQNVIAVSSGREALKQVLQREFAVILQDVNMHAVDGFEMAELIRKRKKSGHTPIIFVTAYLDHVRAVQGYAHGAVDYILAPVPAEVLRAK